MNHCMHQQPLGIHQDMALLPFDLLARIITRRIDVRAAFLGAFNALAVDDAGGRARLPIDQLAALLVELIVNSQQRSVVPPALEVVEQGASRRQVPGDIAPLTPGAQNVQEAIDHLAFIDLASATTTLGWRDQVLQVPPFLVGQVTWIAQLVPVVPRTVLSGPHHTLRESTRSSNHSRVNGFKPPVLTDSKDSESYRTDTIYTSGSAAHEAVPTVTTSIRTSCAG